MSAIVSTGGLERVTTPLGDSEIDEITVKLRDVDTDVTIEFPGGVKMVIQARPSNADDRYNGSLDIILPRNQAVTNWKGDDMEAAPALGHSTYLAQQLVTDLPGIYDRGWTEEQVASLIEDAKTHGQSDLLKEIFGRDAVEPSEVSGLTDEQLYNAFQELARQVRDDEDSNE